MAEKTTPAMRQFHEMKRQVGDAILFFRMGDFYEMFFDDAVTASRALELTLTSRQKDASGGAIPMCGVPHHAADTYIGRLIRRGFKVAVCEQVEDPRQAKGIVRREVVRIVTPSTYLHQGYLEEKEPSYLMAVAPGADELGASLVDLSTGDFFAFEHQGPERWAKLQDALATYHPRELVFPEGSSVSKELLNGVSGEDRPVETPRESWRFDYEGARALLLDQFGTVSLDGFGCEGKTLAVGAAGAALQYLQETQHSGLTHISGLRYREESDHLILDPVTQRNLELTRSLSEGDRRGTLLAVLDKTQNAMGARLLKQWLLRPLLDLDAIGSRLDAVEQFAFDTVTRTKLAGALKSLVDMERVLSRITLGSASPRDFVGLGQSIAVVPRLASLLSELQAPLIGELSQQMDPLEDVRSGIDRTIVAEPPATIRDGGVIRDGVSSELDELRRLRTEGRQTLARIEERERQRTGITTLKVRFNKVFGYYIEVTRSKLDAVPDDYIRKQTLVGAERFITPELKEYEEKITTADERITIIEGELFESLRQEVAAQAARIRGTAEAIASIDVLTSLAEVAASHQYTKPRLHEGFELQVKQARHPVIEDTLGEPFVPNDLELDGDHHLIILTGPNMGGKSTYLRQAALLLIMAQMGSFVPAHEAKLPLVDRIFTRVGASDNLFRGRSTFMVEMQETAHILHHATRKSFVLLDEIGRGTATFDGLSLAWAVAEHIATNPKLQCKTIFATHYHELTDLAAELPGVVNYHVSAREWNEDIVFLRQVVRGGSDRSYGIQVARLAGLPSTLIGRAQEILTNLEKSEFDLEGRPRLSVGAGAPAASSSERQLALFAEVEDRVASELRKLDLDQLTPLQALQILADLKRSLEASD
jgi:DNA mismatch repair protein MutS